MCMVNSATADQPAVQPQVNPNIIPLGDGLADNARLAIRGRQSQIDSLVNQAVSGKKSRK